MQQGPFIHVMSVDVPQWHQIKRNGKCTNRACNEARKEATK